MALRVSEEEFVGEEWKFRSFECLVQDRSEPRMCSYSSRWTTMLWGEGGAAGMDVKAQSTLKEFKQRFITIIYGGIILGGA